jgi:hypothetical protein
VRRRQALASDVAISPAKALPLSFAIAPVCREPYLEEAVASLRGANAAIARNGRIFMELILIIVVVVLLFGGGGYYGRRRGHW